MITLLEGTSERLHGHCAELVTQGDAWLALAPPYDTRPWAGLHRLIGGLRAQHGAAVAGVLETDPAVAYLGLGAGPDGLGRELTDEEARDAAQLGGDRLSHLSHNLLVQHPLFERWAVLLRDLCALAPSLTLVIPDLSLLDRESLSALRRLIRRFPDAAPDLVAGFDPQAAQEPPDPDGLTWRLPPNDVWRLVLGLRTLETTRIETLPAVGPAAAFAALGRQLDDEGAPERPVLQLLAGVRDAFAGFAFTAALRQGLALLERVEAQVPPQLTSSQLAEVHGIVALAAHNRQFRSDGNLPLGHFLQRHLMASWSHQVEPEATSDQAALLSVTAYRLAVVLGRRLKQRSAALEWANRAIDEAQRGAVAHGARRAVHLEAWGRNIRAYLLMGMERVEEAVEDCRQAFTLVDAEMPPAPAATSKDPLLRELAYTRSLLADNLGALLLLRGGEASIDEVAEWKRRSDELAEHVPALVRFENRAWLVLYREQLRLSAALPKALEGAAAAQTEQDALRWLHYTVHAADLEYRLGRAENAYAHFTEASALRGQLGDPPFLRDLTLFRVAAARRAGRQAVAAALLDQLLGRCTRIDDPQVRDERTHLLALRGEIDALRSKATAAQTWLNDAIESALEDGVRDTMLSVALAVARSGLHLGEGDDAAQAYAQALELAAVGEDAAEETSEGHQEAHPALRFEALVGYLDSSGEIDESTRQALCRRALAYLPDALDDADTWWLLANLLHQVRLAGLSLTELEAQDGLAAPVSVLRRAAAQREDCAHLLRQLDPEPGAPSLSFQASEPS